MATINSTRTTTNVTTELLSAAETIRLGQHGPAGAYLEAVLAAAGVDRPVESVAGLHIIPCDDGLVAIELAGWKYGSTPPRRVTWEQVAARRWRKNFRPSEVGDLSQDEVERLYAKWDTAFDDERWADIPR